MKIAVLSAADSIHSWRWVEYFGGAGHDVHWVSMAPFEKPLPKGVTGYFTGPYPKNLLDIWRAKGKIADAIAQAQPDLMHLHYLGMYGFLGALSGFRPIISTAWGSDILISARNPIKGPLIKWVLRQSQVLTCDAYHMRDALIAMGVDRSKIEVIFFGSDCHRFRPGQDARKIRERHNLGDRPVLISTRNLLPIYDVQTLVRAMPQIVAGVPDLHCLVLGRGEERAMLEALAGELNVADKMTFVGPVTGEDMPLYLAAADVYVSTSLSDAGLAASTAEAMATGLPAIVTDTAENATWVEDGTGGFVIPVSQPGVLADKVIQLARDPELRRAMGAHNRPVIEQRNNFFVEMKKMEQLYERIVSGARAARRA